MFPSSRFLDPIGQRHSLLLRMDPRLFCALENPYDAKLAHPRQFPPNNPRAFLLLLARHFPITHVYVFNICINYFDIHLIDINIVYKIPWKVPQHLHRRRGDIQMQNPPGPLTPDMTEDCPSVDPARAFSDSEPIRRPSILRETAISP